MLQLLSMMALAPDAICVRQVAPWSYMKQRLPEDERAHREIPATSDRCEPSLERLPGTPNADLEPTITR
jgi:hypothetical protein